MINIIEFLLSSYPWIRVCSLGSWIQVACSWIRVIIPYLKASSGFVGVVRYLARIAHLLRFPIRIKIVPAWKQIMDEEMDALVSRRPWDLVSPPKGALVVGYHWVYILKYHLNGFVDRYKTRLVAKGYT